MSTEQGKIEAIKIAMSVAELEIERLEFLKSIAGLTIVEELKLDMARDLVERGNKLLGRDPRTTGHEER